MDRVRRLAVTAWVSGALGLVLVITSLAWLRTGYLLSTVPGESMSPMGSSGGVESSSVTPMKSHCG